NSNKSYVTYVVDFSDTAGLAAFEVDDSRNEFDWWTLRIPILAPEYKGSVHTESGLVPEWNRISHVRVWFESEASDISPDTIEIADWYFVQSNWIARGGEEDSLSQFTIATISKEDNTFFEAPPEAESYTDPNTKVTETQRALLLNFESLAADSTYLAEKELITVERFGGYRRIQMYVHADIDAADAGNIQLFFRLGRDTANFYEYHTMLRRSVGLWDKRNWINIDFNEITALKDAAQRNLPTGGRVADVDTTDGPYRVRGAPNINEVRYYAIGLINQDNTGKRVSGEVWLDELRVTDVRRDVGRAGAASGAGLVRAPGSPGRSRAAPACPGGARSSRGWSDLAAVSTASGHHFAWVVALVSVEHPVADDVSFLGGGWFWEAE
ncbi:MAG: hypothetical protein IH968_14835, partial [Gemmatimonadetes bacterium]|nr:hypothetical protein [Gemmatimonadota bacterium]